jgi:hypothetical protein
LTTDTSQEGDKAQQEEDRWQVKTGEGK